MSWGPGALGGFQNSLMMGMQIGENVNRSIMQGRQMREERDYKNALAQFDPSNPDTLKPIMAANPEVGLQLGKQVQEQQAAARKAQIMREAAAGKPEAMAELAGIDINAWRGLTDDQQAAAKQGIDAMGQAALFVATQPPEARAAAWDQQVEVLAQRFPSVAQYRGQYSQTALESAIGQAGKFNEFWQMTKPQDVNVEPGAARYRLRPDGTYEQVIRPYYEQGQTPAPKPAGTKSAPPSKQVGNATYYQNPETGKWYDNPQEAMGGGASNGTGGFQGP